MGCSVITTNRISVEHLEEMLISQYNHDFSEKTSVEREDDPALPNNRCVAKQRLQGLKRKFEKDIKYKEEYTSFLSDMLDQGYAEMVPTEQLEQDDGKVWTSVQERQQTRRGILSVVSSLYDPLGFLAPFTMSAKLMLQELCRRNLMWDEQIPPSFSKQWSDWLSDLQKMSAFTVERCIKPHDFGTFVTAQIHHFSDASQVGYGTVSYLRVEDGDKVHVGFLVGKARVAPLKQITIPRLELTAAVLAVRVDAMLRKELQWQVERSMFWTDSTTVLKYICNETRRFHTFVANRVSVIREATDVGQWKYVSTKINPADEASRGLTAEELLTNGRWIKGPEFLRLSEKEALCQA
ncbi:uncharacterized protein LOC133440659 [Cololabis saira]|uniref:uncharacterized protein LOC133440659 n=1 Tax=Cololabis saira TaxID=129043 RepID=UPI002AD38EF9|nr:uncharacterized protein LOC133440659 [Cololabis saira]